MLSDYLWSILGNPIHIHLLTLSNQKLYKSMTYLVLLIRGDMVALLVSLSTRTNTCEVEN